ncbi:hypothetical protein Bhyg_12529 [Pseudolycoriella hygida]|uniref:DUF4780 domain-containing protein n=1 Tax=Pseudolycoriella hygida TaxID=35572 RepID=A0A9Q0S0H5_9DIPT|nr:hypothetical protein Bhyg_12529 [Pseudolycoriella hygida]
MSKAALRKNHSQRYYSELDMSSGIIPLTSAPNNSEKDWNISDDELLEDSEHSENLHQEGLEELEKTLLNVSTNFGNIAVENHSTVTKKRQLEISNELNPTPAKKPKAYTHMLPSSATIVKMASEDAHTVDILPNTTEPTVFSQTELKAIMASFNNAVISSENFADLRINWSGSDKGRFRIICDDEKTKNWVVSIVDKLENLWKGAQLKSVTSGPPPILKKAHVNVTLPFLEHENFFKVINTQNPLIDTNHWRLMSKSKSNNGKQLWIIGIPEASIEPLRAVSFKPYCGANRIKINVQNAN